MKISCSWLREYIRTGLSPEEISAVFTSIGLEVDGMEEWCPVKGGLEGFVVGEILTCGRHPNADRLSVAVVDVGKDVPLTVVCGAPNVAAGQKVAVAVVGTTVYTKEGSYEIRKSKIRGVESEGMICAEDELGLGDSHDGIMVLDASAVAGTPLKSHFNVEIDRVFEIGLTPNRIDAASHIGAARDLAAWLEVNEPGFSRREGFRIPPVDAFVADHHDLPVEVTVAHTEACPRYAGVTLSGITVGPSPVWLQNRLRAIGLSPINNVVDVTNFVLHETGQPLHAFDVAKIEGGKVIVKTLPEGTPFVTLDGVERKLAADDLMICDARGGMCIGGVFGGLASGITSQTTSVFLESACFNPVYIRRTARRHGLNTDASFRFERGVDPLNTVYALQRAALLIKALAGGAIGSEIVDIHVRPVAAFPVHLNFARIRKLIGAEIAPETIERILAALEIKTVGKPAGGLDVEVPPYRVDVRREADIIEEILRIYGYNNVQFNDKIHSTLAYVQKPEPEKMVNTVSDFLSSCGFNEIISNSLTKTAYYQLSAVFPAEKGVDILNPLSQDLGCMRQTLLYGGLEAILYNVNRRHSDLRLYEFGNCYLRERREGQPLAGFTEEKHLALFITGIKLPVNWNTPRQSADFYTTKAYAENVLKRLGIDLRRLRMAEAENNDLFSESLLYSADGAPLLEVATVNPTLLKRFDLKTPVYYADFRWNEVIKAVQLVKISCEELPRFPDVRRDLSLLVNRQVKFADIGRIAVAAERKLLKDVNLFDVYEDETMAKDKKSYAVSFTLQDMKQTLTDEQIDKAMRRIATALEREAGAQVRQ
ncbi:MAG: phenylalanine--tRNA ligase subunit beta [Bacteroidales bacterium]|jgi:phenylalanyl-tRNA synthetase beta chain|nr:phenylalanine--tRNA ligase subunit beta [Bacteroidales bacterium]